MVMDIVAQAKQAAIIMAKLEDESMVPAQVVELAIKLVLKFA